MQIKKQEEFKFKKRISSGDHNNRPTRIYQDRIIYSLVTLNVRQDSNIDKETAFDYFRKQKAFQKVVANKSYAQIVKSATYQNQGNNTRAKNFGQRTPLDKRVVNKKQVANTHNQNVARTKASKAPQAGVKPHVSYTENSITLNNRFQIRRSICLD